MEIDPNIFLSALADTTRLRMVALLLRHKELCVCELVAALDTHQPKVSKHLAILRKAGLIRGRRAGQWIHYSLHPELPAWASGAISEIGKGCEPMPQLASDEARLSAFAAAYSCSTN